MRQLLLACFITVMVVLSSGFIVGAGEPEKPQPKRVVVVNTKVPRDLKAEAYYIKVMEYAAAVQYQKILHFAWLIEQAKKQTAYGVWDRLANCESSGNWSINTGSFDGGLQFLPSTWVAQGGRQYAPYAWQATREQQITIAGRLLASTNGSYRASWPACSRRLGLP